VRVRAPNPSPLTLDGTNTYVVDGWVVDPGPDDPGHLEAVLRAGPLRGIALTHGHADHSDGAPRLSELAGGIPVERLGDGERAGPFEAIATPGHAEDHVCLLVGRVLFSGDTVLGAGSVFVGSDGGSMAAYMDSLERLRELELDVICPGHGPFVWEPRAKIEEYIAHRRERERKLLAALDDGLRDEDELLDAVWDDAPAALRPAAAVTLAAHREKLRAEGRWPRPGGGTPAP
jgi:glyoxylase-like metal-dependent hydrolase (beta-lactamase superfamily II)